MMDVILELWVSGLVELSKLQWMLGIGKPWAPGVPLKLLFAGYNGNRNTGADVRVEEMIRQVRQILGEDNLDLSVLSHNLELSRGYFQNTRQVKLPDIYPPFLFREVSQYHGVIACEGSMFKSKFANALTNMMIEALGIAAAQNKLSVGYGAEAGYMDPFLERMCRRFCSDSLVITRNEESQAVLGKLGVPTELGTDTAWTFEPLGPEFGNKALREAGWDGRIPVLGLCPINPYWWPVRPSLAKLVLRKSLEMYRDSHYRSIYFHNNGRRVEEAFLGYLKAFSSGVTSFCRDHRVFPVMIGMEALDRRACEMMARHLGGVPLFISDQYDMYQLVSILRSCHLLISSRYHAIVTSMPALIPSAGVAMDERIRNLMRERGQKDLLLEVDDPDLDDKLVDVLVRLKREGNELRQAIGRTVVRNLKVMGRMGVYFQEHVLQRYPEFPVRLGPLSWESYLPSMGLSLQRLVETFEE
ncbi:MAG TPA: polysaccharide pyruvyl transferase family protein [Terriglobia bacterium]|nr:polysaccharide pyruvyl transferase family protein [Terriglobia bacterium]